MILSSSSTSCSRCGHSLVRMHMTQRMHSTMPCITIRQPTIEMSHLNGHTIGPFGLAEECSFMTCDNSAKP